MSLLTENEKKVSDQLFEQLHDLVEELLKGHFGLASGLMAEQRIARQIPSNQIKDYDVEIVVGGARAKPGKPRLVYLNVTKKSSGETRQVSMSAEREQDKRVLRISLGAKLGVYSVYHGFVMNDEPCEPPKEVKDLAAFRESITGFFERFTSLIRDWRNEYSSLASARKVVETTDEFDF